MNVLALDSATEALVVALRAGPRLYTRCVREGLRHAQTMVPQVQQVLAQASIPAGALDLVVVGVGPGSFTGLRIALSTAAGLARGAGCPVVGIPTLDAIAWPTQAWPGVVVAVLDARKGRVYAACYRGAGRVSEFLDVAAEDLPGAVDGQQPVLVTGPFAREVGSRFPSWTLDPAHAEPSGIGLLELGIAASGHGGGAQAVPVYLRKTGAETSIT